MNRQDVILEKVPEEHHRHFPIMKDVLYKKYHIIGVTEIIASFNTLNDCVSFIDRELDKEEQQQ